MAWNSDYFDLSNWKITLPVDGNGNNNRTATEVKSLKGYESEFFYDASDGAMVFKAHCDGATTSGSKYARCELREMNGSDRAAWKLSEGGTMSATLKIDHMPSNSSGDQGRIVVGQIHGKSDELVRLYYDNGRLYFRNDQAGSKNSELSFYFKNAKGEEPQVALGEKFSYLISAKGDTLIVSIHADGQVYTSETKINSVWSSDEFYFKAGLYLGNNESNGSGYGQVSFYGLDFGHKAGEGDDAWNAAVSGTPPTQNPTPPAEEPTPPTETPQEPTFSETIRGNNSANTLTGTAADEELKGYDGDDILRGRGGDDLLWGNNHNDTLIGGLGRDTLKGGPGDDIYVFESVNDAGDTILDYVQSQDKIDLSDIPLGYTDFDAAVKAGAIRMTQVGSSVELRVTVSGKEYLLATLVDTQTGELASGNFIMPKVVVTPPPAPIPPAEEPTPPTETPQEPTFSETIRGNNSANTLTGTAADEELKGYDGDDILRGRGGDDLLWGNNHNDTLIGGLGRDTLKGGPGDDIYVFESVNDAGDTILDYVQSQDKIDLSGIPLGYTDFSAAVKAGAIRLTQVGEDVELRVSVAGQQYLLATLVDTQTGELASGNFIMPKSTTQPVPPPATEPPPTNTPLTLNGTSSGDKLNGGAGNDIINGNAGNDVIYGGSGKDTLTGGSGKDSFVYKNVTDAGDAIMDFCIDDKLDITVLVSTFKGNSSTDIDYLIDHGYLDFRQVNDTTHHVYVDIDGSGGALDAMQLATLTTPSWFDSDPGMFICN